ncbi:hypothetical protein N7509_008539 [Penicillium cosmopolitanum]|uniref:Uncharacterized protein n=1 Tax=Penicillium cosmopolitanum TaxID=1131564 RepID=A0A9X0B2T3_9EURO|nr:uncharacterized protein N7509_008539 [Penicillium cosmopolitanum]KAJ5385998.1 hypothetical protein N7509_008539 [Penicillium cosmopolitanum]
MAGISKDRLHVFSIDDSLLTKCLLGALFVGACFWAWRRSQARGLRSTSSQISKGNEIKRQPVIMPLKGFRWESTEPLQLRPFRGKEKYNLTMAIENLDPSELIQMDKTYLGRISKRKAVLDQHHDVVVAVNDPPLKDPRIRAAVSELYTFILGTYLPTRYPTMFQLDNSPKREPTVENRVTGARWPTILTEDMPTIRALEILTQTVDEEFLILLPDTSALEETSPYVLQAYATCFPSGFNTRDKLGLRLADIHGPVPGYAEKIERSMDKFLTKIEVGRFVKRVNWGVTTETDLFAAFGSVHASPSADPQKGHVIRPGMLNIDQTVLRCERQTLHRLPQSKAIVFAFHTYTYPVQQIKNEGMGEDLATAIEGLKKGNVPSIYSYKRGDIWGQAVTDFLRA